MALVILAGPPKSGSEVGVRPNTVNKPSPGTRSDGFKNTDYVDAVFGGSNPGKRKNIAAIPSSTAQNSLFDGVFQEEERNVKQTSSQSSFSTKKAFSSPSIGNDFTALFGDITTSSGEFHEIEGEPAERRRARLNRFLKTNERMRLGETLDIDIKRWAAGKEGNLRALLSSLQQVDFFSKNLIIHHINKITETYFRAMETEIARKGRQFGNYEGFGT